MTRTTAGQHGNGRKETSLASLLTPLTTLGLTGYLFIGAAAVLIPSVMPFLTNEYGAAGLTLSGISVLFITRLGGVLGNLLAGFSSDRLGYYRLVLFAALALGAAFALVTAARPWSLFLAGFVLVSVIQSSLTTGINAMVADANRPARARALNLLHGVYAVGATVFPLLFGLVLERGAPWRWLLAATALVWLLYAGGSLLFFRPGRTPASIEKPKQAVDWGMLRNAGFLSLFLIAFIYNGVAVSLLGWVALYMQKTAGLSVFGSVSTISVFYVALTAGRFLCAAYAERIGYARTLLTLTALLIVTYPLVIFNTAPAPLMLGVFFTGLSLSGLFPTGLAYGSRLYPEHSGAVTGLLNVAMIAGMMLPPYWTGIFADVWNLQTALGINYAMAWLLLAVCLYLARLEPRTERIDS